MPVDVKPGKEISILSVFNPILELVEWIWWREEKAYVVMPKNWKRRRSKEKVAAGRAGREGKSAEVKE